MQKDTNAAPELVLASASETRRRLLDAAGVPYTAEVARIDEAEVRASLAQEKEMDALEMAVILAEMKARPVAQRHPRALCLGADQILVQDGTIFGKPESLDAARAQLCALRGNMHQLCTAAVIVRDGSEIWRSALRARLWMRPFSDEFLDDYLAVAGADVFASVGGYQIEGWGAQLFARIEGDHFGILGLPLLPLLGFLREWGIIDP